MERATVRHEEASNEHNRVSSEVEQDLARLAELTEHIAERAAHIIELRNEVTSLRSELEEVHAERAAAEHRLKSLEDLDAHHAYYSDAVQQVLSPEQAARVNALGTLADFVEVEAQYEKLIESLFGRELQCMLVPTIDDALAGVEFIKSESLGRGAFLVVGLHGGEEETEDGTQPDDETEPRHSNGIERWLVDSESAGKSSRFQDEYIPIERQLPPADFAFTEPFVDFPDAGYQMPLAQADDAEEEEFQQHRIDDRRFDEEASREAGRFQLDVLRAIDLLNLRPGIKTVVERAFPDKCAASVVPDIEAALQLSIENPSLVYVTYEGEQVVNGRLIVTGGQAGQRGTSLLGLKREIKQLRVQTAMLGDEEQRIADDLLKWRASAKGLKAKRHCSTASFASTRKPQPRAIRSLKDWRATSNARRNTSALSKSELEQAAEERAEIQSRIEQLLAETSAAEASRAERAIGARRKAIRARRIARARRTAFRTAFNHSRFGRGKSRTPARGASGDAANRERGRRVAIKNQSQPARTLRKP